MFTRSQKTAETAPPARDLRGAEGAYGARIDELFREAIRDLDEMKRPGASEPSK